MDRTWGRRETSDAVSGEGWRYLLGALRASVRVGSLAEGIRAAADAAAVCGEDADGHLRVDVRAERVVLTVQTFARGVLTARDVTLALAVSGALREAGWTTVPEVGTGAARSVQQLEIAIDALDIGAVRPFWRAVLGYVGEAGAEGPEDPLVDPVGEGPAMWFQQMDAPRPQRNRFHIDVCVPHDEAAGRIDAALAAGGRLLSAARAPAFWVLADAEGNEACVTTWQGRGD
ncbi:VOC family protein [Streptomyces avicenniae]|uniref:VOC family protein n=1 Tax=Streptomyces avicenniae TaxID=500153 RepID=UPI00069BEE4B|nr:VOC family protein [Streptomyces avicenniae]